MLSETVNRRLLGATHVGLWPTIGMESWPDRLRRLRAATGLSQAKVATAMGIKPASVAGWELGKSRPDPDRFPMLARLYNVTVQEICGDDLPMPGQGDRIALLRLYDEMDEEAKQDLLRAAVRFARAK